MDTDSVEFQASIFQGLSRKQIEVVTKGKCQLSFQDGETIFNKDDLASGLFIVLRGAVEIFLPNDAGGVPIARLGVNGIFGEMGLISGAGRRTASTRATGDTVVLSIPGDAGFVFHMTPDTDAAMLLLQNLVRLLGERLQGASVAAPRGGPAPMLVSDLHGQPGETAFKVLKMALPRSGLLNWLAPKRRLRPNEYLCRQGDEASGFFLVFSGALEVSDETDDRAPRLLTHVRAPNVVGQVAFFSGGRRLASCRAVETVEYAHFSSADYQRLRKRDAREALRVLFAAAQLVVQLIVERQARLCQERQARSTGRQ